MKKRIISILMALVMALSLLPAGALAAGLPFTDVKTSDWFYNDVKNAYDKGLINGKTATTFEPNSNLTYAEAVKLAACMNQRNATGMVTLVNGNPWYATYVNYAKDNGIISKDYDWNAKATRAGYMEIFANALPAANLKPVNNVPDGAIPDVPMSHPQADAIYTLYRAGILQGSDSQHSCKPNDNIKRSEVAAILTRMMDVKERISFSMAEEVEELTITAQPKDVVCAVGDTAEFTVMAAGGKEPYKYQWQTPDLRSKVWTNITGATSATYTYKNVSDLSFSSSIRCVITDADGNTVTSNEAKVVKKTEPLTITTQPKDVAASIPAGSSAFSAGFTVEVTGGKAPYTYQWQYGLTTGNGWNDFKGTENWANPATVKQSGLLVGSSNADMLTAGYQFRCVITDADGNKVTTSAAKLTPEQATQPLTITAQPKDVTCSVGDTATFTVAASGGKAPYTYQWEKYRAHGKYYSWAIMDGATSNTYKVTNVTDEMFNFKYRCVITDADGNTVTSNEAKLVKKTEALTITTQPKDVACSVGDTATFTVAVSGGKEPYTYSWQWKRGTNFDPISRVTFNESEGLGTDTFKIKNISQNALDWNADVRCVVTDADGNTVTSSGAKLSKKIEPLTIKTQPQNATVFAVGDTVSFEVAVNGGTPGYVYEWQFKFGSSGTYSKVMNKGSETTGQGTSKLTIQVKTGHFTSNTIYKCVIKDAKGNTVTTNEVTLQVQAKPLSVSVGCAGVNERENKAMITANVSGGVAPYTYRWNNGATETTNATWSSIWVRKGLGGSCTVTDATGKTVSGKVAYDPYWFEW